MLLKAAAGDLYDARVFGAAPVLPDVTLAEND
jgi:hypothetical protein